MGKRGKPSSWTFELQLRRRIQDCTTTTNSISVEQLVDRLRAYHPDYRRHKLLPFTRHVKQALDSITPKPQTPTRPSSSTTDHDDDDDGDYRSPSRKRSKKIDPSEQRLQELETQHILRKRTQNQNQNEEDEIGSVSSSSDDDEEDDSAVSTSDDTVYGEESEPKFDLMQAIIRKKYTDSVKSKVKEKKQENVELEVVNNGKEGSKKVDLMREDKGKRGGSNTTLKKSNKVSDEGVEEKVKEGPRFKDLGGMDKVIDELKMEVMVPLYHPELPRVLGVRPMAGILLHGPPGCGKTKLAHAIANEAGVPFYKISATELVSGISGASEENIRELFSKAYRTAPAIVFIDEIDAIASKRENLQREMERRIVTQLMTCMDESHKVVQPADTQSNSENSDSKAGYVLVIGATNRPDAVDPALRRPGRFDREIALGVPDENARIGILTVLTSNMKLEGSFDLLKIARSTPGFVGADLAALANKAGNLAMKRIIDQRKLELSKESKDGQQGEEWLRNPWSSEEMEKLSITMEDFEEAAKMVQPSSRREGFSSIPDVKWEDVGGLDLLRHEFDRYIVRRIKHPEDYEEFGLDTETGFLLYGPPGCGKTLIAKAVANEAGANFIHIKGPELLNKYVGESELQVRMIFTRARTCAPCIVFFDEVDALTTKRGKEGGWVVERLLNQLLIELHGADQRKGVFVIGATNRPEVMDPAVLRPGRFGKLLYVPLPSPEQRGLILKALGRKKPINADVDLISIGKKEACANLSGADLSALMNEAAMAALDERLALAESCSGSTALTINAEHFEQALTKVSPSVSDKQKEYYDRLSEHFKAT